MTPADSTDPVDPLMIGSSDSKLLLEQRDHGRQEHHRQLGFHRQGQFSKIIDIDECFLIDEKMRAVFTHCKNILKST